MSILLPRLLTFVNDLLTHLRPQYPARHRAVTR